MFQNELEGLASLYRTPDIKRHIHQSASAILIQYSIFINFMGHKKHCDTRGVYDNISKPNGVAAYTFTSFTASDQWKQLRSKSFRPHKTGSIAAK